MWKLPLLLLATVCATVACTEGALRCRRCVGAATLDDCTFSVPCPTGEICYMDMVVTDQLTVEYNGGCRPRDVCQRGSPIVGKRGMTYVACTGCCDTQASPECNSKTCGIKSNIGNITQCYHCASGDFGGSGVPDPNRCTNLVSCQSDQVCGAETFRLSSLETYEFRCFPRAVCTLLTRESLKQLDRCKSNPDSYGCSGITRRRSSGHKICTACCGDSQCNSESCENIIERLYQLWKGGVLDLNTLKVNGTMPTALTTTTRSSGHTPVG